MNDLTGVLKLLFDFLPGAVDAGLAQVNCVRQKGTSGLNAAAVTPVLQIHAFCFEKFAEVVVKLFFIYLFHKVVFFLEPWQRLSLSAITHHEAFYNFQPRR